MMMSMDMKLSSLHEFHSSNLKLGFTQYEKIPNFCAIKPRILRPRFVFSLAPKNQSNGSPILDGTQERVLSSDSGRVQPVYTPTPLNRALRTPHSGYHYDGSSTKFFEGWYFKVSIPKKRQSFCFMYAVDNPSFQKELSSFEIAHYGPRNTGVGVQILGADDKHELMLGHAFNAEKNARPPKKEEFNTRVFEGFQVSLLWHQGFIRDDGRANFAEIVETARYEYITQPVGRCSV